jgi:hypothetical protein
MNTVTVVWLLGGVGSERQPHLPNGHTVINENGSAYWTTGITVRWKENAGSREDRSFSGWAATP